MRVVSCEESVFEIDNVQILHIELKAEKNGNVCYFLNASLISYDFLTP